MEIIIPTQCEICHAPMNKIPAGISKKTGKPYNEFYACSVRDCGWTWKKPTQQQLEGEKRHEEVMDALRKLWVAVEEMKKEFKSFTVIFGKNEEPKGKV